MPQALGGHGAGASSGALNETEEARKQPEAHVSLQAEAAQGLYFKNRGCNARAQLIPNGNAPTKLAVATCVILERDLLAPQAREPLCLAPGTSPSLIGRGVAAHMDAVPPAQLSAQPCQDLHLGAALRGSGCTWDSPPCCPGIPWGCRVGTGEKCHSQG